MAKLTGRFWTWELPHVHQWKDRKTHIHFTPNPIIQKDTQIVTIGSCFAQELADAMQRFHLKGAMHPGGLFYNTASIRQEFERIFGYEKDVELETCWKIEQGYIHPYKAYTEFFGDPEKLQKWSNKLDESADMLFRSANLFVITLGLIEVWMEEKTGRIYRQLPPPEVLVDRNISFRQLTNAEMMADLERINQIIQEHTNAKLLITVSPVPLHATFTDQDVRIANSVSKSRIRTAVSEFIARHPDVYYFHSYEIVTSAERSSDFMKEDGRHVHKHAVDYILNQFLKMYASEDIPISEVDTSWLSAPSKVAAIPKPDLKTRLYWMRRKIFPKK